MTKTKDDLADELERGVKEENVYSETAREELIEGDEISAVEEAFMKGYDDDMNQEEKEEDEEKPSD